MKVMIKEKLKDLQYYELKLMLGPMTYCISVLLTFGVSLVIGMMVARKNKKIDMVEALKIAE